MGRWWLLGQVAVVCEIFAVVNIKHVDIVQDIVLAENVSQLHGVCLGSVLVLKSLKAHNVALAVAGHNLYEYGIVEIAVHHDVRPFSQGGEPL